jgi:hypothetical protein
MRFGRVFYYSPIAEGKNTWLINQAVVIGVYFVGMVLAFAEVNRELKAV